MSSAERLVLDRANREAAHRVFAERLARIKADIEARGLGSRVAGTVVGEASEAIDVGLDVAREHKGLIAGTIGALLLWIFRQPLFATLVTLYGRARGETDQDIEDESRDEDQ